MHPKASVAVEFGNNLKVLRHLTCYDQLDVANVAGAELIARRTLQIQRAVRQNPCQPSSEGLEAMFSRHLTRVAESSHPSSTSSWPTSRRTRPRSSSSSDFGEKNSITSSSAPTPARTDGTPALLSRSRRRSPQTAARAQRAAEAAVEGAPAKTQGAPKPKGSSARHPAAEDLVLGSGLTGASASPH